MKNKTQFERLLAQLRYDQITELIDKCGIDEVYADDILCRRYALERSLAESSPRARLSIRKGLHDITREINALIRLAALEVS